MACLANAPMQQPKEYHSQPNHRHSAEDAGGAVSRPRRRSNPSDELVDYEDAAVSYPSAGRVVQEKIATCIAVHRTAVVLGTRCGEVHSLNPEDGSMASVFDHSAPVHDVCLDSTGKVAASCGADGLVAVVEFTVKHKEPWIMEQSRPVFAVALCPSYASETSRFRAVCFGGEDARLMLTKKGGMLNTPEVVHANEGSIVAVAWRGSLVAWANSKGIKVFDVDTRQKVTYVARPVEVGLPDGSPTEDSCRCRMTWASDESLLVGWGDHIKCLAIRQKTGEPPGVWFGEVQHHFRMPDLIICGLAPLGSNLCVLTLSSRDATPQLHLCNRNGETFHSSPVPLPGPVGNKLGRDLSLGFAGDGLPLHVLGPCGLLKAHRRDLTDHAVWLVENGQAHQAVELANAAGSRVAGLQHVVCVKCIVPLLREQNFSAATEVMRSLRVLDAATWQECILLFDQCKALQYLAVDIPVPPHGIALPQDVYDMALESLVAYPSALVAILSWWPKEIFSVTALIERLKLALTNSGVLGSTGTLEANKALVQDLSEDDSHRVNALALMLDAMGNTYEAVEMMVAVDSADLFPVLQRGLQGVRQPSDITSDRVQQLLDVATREIPRIFQIDPEKAREFYVQHYIIIRVEEVVKVLQDYDKRFLHEYLKLLFQHDSQNCAKYHLSMVRLYAEFEPRGLMQFLKSRWAEYPIDGALGVCQQRNLYSEQAFLLKRQGHTDEALDTLLIKLSDVRAAVDFVAEYNDDQLWDKLLNFVLEDQPREMVVELLECLEQLNATSAGANDLRPPTRPGLQQEIVKRMPSGLRVPRIASTVAKVLEHAELQHSLMESSRNIVQAEMLFLQRQVMFGRRRGRAFPANSQLPVVSWEAPSA